MKKSIVSIMLSTVASFALIVNPIPINIPKDYKYAEFHLGDDTSKYQVFVKRWIQKDGKDILKDTKNIFVFPKVFQAPKTIKIFVKKKNPNKEIAYRLIFKELRIKKQQEEQTNKAMVLKTLSIPLFVKPSKEKPNLKIECKDNSIKIENKGNVHIKVLSINNKKSMFYILPYQLREVKNVDTEGFIKTEDGKYTYKCKE